MQEIKKETLLLLLFLLLLLRCSTTTTRGRLRRKRKRESLIKRAESPSFLLKQNVHPKPRKKGGKLETLNVAKMEKKRCSRVTLCTLRSLSSEKKREKEGEERTLARAKEREKRVRLRRLSLRSVSHSFIEARFTKRERDTHIYPTSDFWGIISLPNQRENIISIKPR